MTGSHTPIAACARLAGGAMLAALLALAGCSTAPVKPGAGKGASSGARPSADAAGARPPAASRGGAYYLDDGPGDNPPPDLLAVPDAVPRAEPLHPFANRPYRVFGVAYVPRPDLTEHRERGVASWYGRKFHGRRTSSGEPYDMYAMTAAHPTLPIPSYVRVTHLRNGRSVVVRVNDRGPFLHRRVIDLSYTAAYRLGYVENGHAEVEVELLSPSGASPGPSAVAGGGGAPAPAPTGAAAGPATWLQLGAFSSRGNAEAALARIARDAPWLAMPVDLLRQGDTWRVQVGPWTSREDALAAAARIASNGVFRPIPVVR